MPGEDLHPTEDQHLHTGSRRTPALIPGATYRINDMTTLTAPGGRKFRGFFVARAGETIDLGDILIEKPE